MRDRHRLLQPSPTAAAILEQVPAWIADCYAYAPQQYRADVLDVVPVFAERVHPNGLTNRSSERPRVSPALWYHFHPS